MLSLSLLFSTNAYIAFDFIAFANLRKALPPQCGSLHYIAVAVHHLTLRCPCVASPIIALAVQLYTTPLLSNALLFLSSAIYSMLFLRSPLLYSTSPLHALAVLRSALPMLCHACPSLFFCNYATHCSAIRNYAIAILSIALQGSAVAALCFAPPCLSFALP